MEPTIKTAVVGYGMSATVFHLPFIKTNPAYELVAVVQRSGDTAAQHNPGIAVFRSFEEMLRQKEIELVVITTPNETHFPFAKAALQAGKHVVLEKPFTNTSAEATALIELAHGNNCILSVYQNRRYVSDFKTIVHLLQNSMLGEVHEYICHFHRYRPEAKPNAWREAPLPGSGILYDLGSHIIDQALCLFGLPDTITAFIKKQRPHARIDDYFDIRLGFGNTTAIMKSSMLVREMGPRYQVHGSEGSFIKWGDDPQEALLKEGVAPTASNWGMEPPETKGQLHTFFNGHILQEKVTSLPGNFGEYYNHLFHSIRRKKALSEKPEHGYNTVKLIELALESNRLQKTIDCDGLMRVPYPFDLPESV